MEHETDMKTR